MADFLLKIKILQIYPQKIFNEDETMELILNHKDKMTQKHVYPFTKEFSFNFSKTRKIISIDARLMKGTTTIAEGPINISMLLIHERKEVSEQLIILDMNKNYKRKLFGLIPYTSFRFSIGLSFFYSDTPFGNQYIYKSNSIKNVNLEGIKKEKNILIKEWPSRNLGFVRNNSVCVGTTKYKKKESETTNFKSIRMFFNKTIILSTYSPKKISRRIEPKSKIAIKNKQKLAEVKKGISQIYFPKQQNTQNTKKHLSKNVKEIVARSVNKMKKKDDNQKSMFSEQHSIEVFDNNNNMQTNEIFFTTLNNQRIIEQNLKDINEFHSHFNSKNNKELDMKQAAVILIDKCINIVKVYAETYNMLIKKNHYCKKALSKWQMNIQKVDELNDEYTKLVTFLVHMENSTNFKSKRDNDLVNIIRGLIKELKLIKFFRMKEYDEKQYSDYQKKILLNTFSNVKNNPFYFNKLSDENKKKVSDFANRYEKLETKEI